MSMVRANIAISLDGFIAGPNQSEENGLGEGGEALHEWAFPLAAFQEVHGREGGEENASSQVLEESFANVGARVMGRNMFGGGPGPWDEHDPWNGWWGDEPPFSTPVYVLTHHEREPLEFENGTVFHFVTDGIESALEQARAAAGEEDIHLPGGAETINEYLAAGEVDELLLHVVPVLLGDGARLFEGVGPDVALEQLQAVEAPGVTHVKYRVG